jgi:hypothetical protein
MRNQATRCTQAELAYLAFWESKGYTIKPGEPVPLNTVTPPSFATRRPKIDAALSGLVLLVGAMALCCLLAGFVTGWFKWLP